MSAVETHTEALRLLVVMSRYPHPPRSGSAIVAVNHIKRLAKHHFIHLVCLGEADDPGEFAQCVSALDLVPKSGTGPLTSFLKNLLYLLRGEPVFVTKNRSREMLSRIKAITQSTKFDAVLLFESSAIQYLPQNCYSRTVVNIEDPPSLKLDRMLRLSSLPMTEKLKILVSAKAIAKFERDVLPQMANVLLLSESDIDDMRARSGLCNLAYVCYGASHLGQQPLSTTSERDRNSILFSGTMSHPPNIDAALFLLTEIFPRILEQNNMARLWIVGANPDPAIFAAAKRYGDHVKVTGKVADMTVYLKRAMVSVCPVRLKIGVQTKILEALSWGTPVVTTHAGNSGIGATSGRDLWVADEPLEFSQRVVELLNGDRWGELSEAGRSFVGSNNTWSTSVMQLEDIIRRLPNLQPEAPQ